MESARLEQLLSTENEQLQKLHAIVLEALEEEKLLSQKLYEFEEKNPPLSSRLADILARFGGSWKFILVFFAFLLAWVATNVALLSRPFDPFPFILLNLFLSTLAAIQAPVIMMSQNRREERDRRRAVNDYLVNLKAEVEVRTLHQKIDLLISEQMKTLFEIQKAQFEMMEEIKKGISDSNNKVL